LAGKPWAGIDERRRSGYFPSGFNGNGAMRASEFHSLAITAALILAAAIAAVDARAEEDLLDFLFGPDPPERSAPSRGGGAVRPRFRPRPSLRRAARPAARPASFRFVRPAASEITPGAGAGAGAGDGFCVRVCDGYFFPLIKSERATRQQSCEYACPSAPMAIYEGSTIEGAHSRKGEPYTRLPTAFQFRDKPTQHCACSRPDTALAYYQRIVRSDPTLRRGDIVIAANGALVYRGPGEGGAFTPLARASFVPGDTRRKLWSVLERMSRAAPRKPKRAP
jgi:hypothetical protein